MDKIVIAIEFEENEKTTSNQFTSEIINSVDKNGGKISNIEITRETFLQPLM